MIEMPSARMAPDGALSVGASFFQHTQRYNLGFQALPWLETSFRYSGLQHFDPDYPVYYDRSFALKARLWDEGRIIPAVAVGINDLIGTGIYSSEYVVASKSFGSVDASLGLGWGRLASARTFDNPLASLSTSWEQRPSITAPGGTNFNVYFHGPDVGLFGGLVWRTPLDGLSLIAEYSSDRYTLERSRGGFRPRNQINLGASYNIKDTITVGANWLYGRGIGINVTLQFDPTEHQARKLGKDPIPVAVRTQEEQRQALLIMLESRQASRQGTSPAWRSSKNAAVDAFWQQSGNLMEVEIRGDTLFVTTKSSQIRCESTAQLAEAFGSSFNAILVKHGTEKNGCAVQAQSLAQTHYNQDSLQPSSAAPPLVASIIPSPSAQRAADNIAIRAVYRDVESQRISIEALSFNGSTASVYYTNHHYFAERDALDRLLRVLMADAPTRIEAFHLVAIEEGIPQKTFDVLRSPQERNFVQNGALDIFDPTTRIASAPLNNPILSTAALQTYPRFSWDVFPQIRQQLFDPNDPFAVQILLGADAKIELLPGLSLNTEVETSLFDNFNKNRPASSDLPHVRSDFLKYFAQGKTGIGELDAQYRFRLAPDVFAIAKAGYLESMFSGVGGEILWRPAGQRWALGGDLYQVWQRDFNRLFGLQSYRVLTGHLSLYYASPWHDLNFALRVGQYLAGDRGMTLEITRRFSTGVEIGAFATKTNVSAQQYGEGSFDKGIIIRIPIGWIAPIETQGQLGFDLRPVQRDGGQRLLGDAILYGEIRRLSETDA